MSAVIGLKTARPMSITAKLRYPPTKSFIIRIPIVSSVFKPVVIELSILPVLTSEKYPSDTLFIASPTASLSLAVSL